jgi:predicted enzyme related to lactoylglutathione lyase
MSRSPAIASAVLTRTASVSLTEAVQRIAATGPCDISPGLWDDVSSLLAPPTTHRLKLVVIRSMEPAHTVRFYSLLGMQFQEEQHGSGPIHWAASVVEIVLEIYSAKSAHEVDSTTRLGFEVTEAGVVLERLRTAGFEVVKELSRGPWGTRAVVRDSDGRSVEIVQAMTSQSLRH